MNALRNQVQLIGRVGNQPELKIFKQTNKMTRISLATNEHYKNNKGEKVSDTQWHTLIAWGNMAENIVRMVEKGNELVIKGKLTHRNYEDTQGIKRNVSEIVIREFLKITGK